MKFWNFLREVCCTRSLHVSQTQHLKTTHLTMFAHGNPLYTHSERLPSAILMELVDCKLPTQTKELISLRSLAYGMLYAAPCSIKTNVVFTSADTRAGQLGTASVTLFAAMHCMCAADSLAYTMLQVQHHN